MFALTRKTDYALVALAAMARLAGRVSARDLADRLSLPLPVLRNILKQLTQEGLVSSTRGQQGGYALARTPERITVIDLIEAMEGPMRLTLCCMSDEERERRRAASGGERHHCDLEGSCMIRRPVQHVHGLVRDLLSRVTLAQIARDEVPSEVTGIPAYHPMPRAMTGVSGA